MVNKPLGTCEMSHDARGLLATGNIQHEFKGLKRLKKTLTVANDG